MELIGQRTKNIMEECKTRAKAAGLEIQGETLEYIVTNQDMLELGPKLMIPTLYDYWVHDVKTVRDKWVYDISPHNPYETVINTRPAISFYNDNNPDWLNIMIFYHVLFHIDFFQNNIFFRKTWHSDFCGEALADRRLINRIREEMGSNKRWADYVIEFARGVDNLVGYYSELEEDNMVQVQSVLGTFPERVDFYFGDFLKQRCKERTVEMKFYHDEVERYNNCQKQFGQKQGEDVFFDDPVFKSRFPEFNGVLKKHKKKKKIKSKDILQHLMDHSEFINKEENKWMKDILAVVRRTSLYFQPQLRTKIANETWASLWHERLFITDDRITANEINFARVNSGVVMSPRLGLNPYSMPLFEFIEELARKGKLSYGYQLLKDSEARKLFDQKLGKEAGKEAMFGARRNFDDFMLVNFLSDDDFQDFVDRHNLFVAGRRLNVEEDVIEIYVKSRSGKEYRKMLNDRLYHPPYILINEEKAEDGELYLDHVYEGRTLITKYIPAVLAGLSYFTGGNMVKLETTEFKTDIPVGEWRMLRDMGEELEYERIRALYVCEGQDIERIVLSDNGSDGSKGA